MNPLDKEVAEWLESLGFFRSVGQAWMHNDVGGDILPPQATFFYTAFKAQREQIFSQLRRSAPDDQSLTGYQHARVMDWFPENQEEVNAWNACNRDWNLTIAELEAQLNQSKLEKGYKDE